MSSSERRRIEAKFFRGLADPTRLGILETLLDGEKTVTEINETLGQSQSNVSNHLKCLSECGLVSNRRSGKNVYYQIRDDEVTRLFHSAQNILSKIHQQIATCVRYEE